MASSPSLFAAVSLQDNPFYGFFAIRELAKIDFDTGLELLARKAVHEGKTELAGSLRTPLGRARARAIHHLAAGNHRAYVVLFDFLDKESLEDLVGPFMDMVDDLTPYYQDRMRQLPPAQRKIVEFLCLEGKPLTIKDISTPCLMSHQTAAKQLGELTTAGFVSRMRSGRNTFCELSEPLMRICIEVKDNKTQHFRLFVEFLRHWFTTRELERRHASFQHDDHLADMDRIHVAEAVRCSLADGREPFVDALNEEAGWCWNAGDYRGLAAIQETLVQDGGSADDHRVLVLALVNVGDTKSAIRAGREAVAKFADDADLHYWLTRAYFEEGRFAEALSAIDRAIALDCEDAAFHCIRADVLLGLERFEEAIQDAQAVLDRDAEHWHSFEQIIEALVSVDRPRRCRIARANELVQLAPAPSRMRFSPHQGSTCPKTGWIGPSSSSTRRWKSTPTSSRRAICADLSSSGWRTTVEQVRIFGSTRPITRIPYPRTAGWPTSLLRSGEPEEAVGVAEHLIEIDSEHSHAHYVRGRALIELEPSRRCDRSFRRAPSYQRLPLIEIRRLGGSRHRRLCVGRQVPRPGRRSGS